MNLLRADVSTVSQRDNSGSVDLADLYLHGIGLSRYTYRRAWPLARWISL